MSGIWCEFRSEFCVNFEWKKKGCILCEPVNQISGTIFQEFSRCKFPRNFHAISRGFSRQFSCNFPWAELYGWLVARRGRRGMQEAHASVLENPRSHTWERCRMTGRVRDIGPSATRFRALFAGSNICRGRGPLKFMSKLIG